MPAQTYRPNFAQLAEEMCRCGASDQALADRFGVNLCTIHRWKHRYPEFRAALLAAGRRLGGGRAPSYRPSFAPLAEALCRRGAINKDLAVRFRVAVCTIVRWRHRHPEFGAALAAGKAGRVGRQHGLGPPPPPPAPPPLPPPPSRGD